MPQVPSRRVLSQGPGCCWGRGPSELRAPLAADRGWGLKPQHWHHISWEEMAALGPSGWLCPSCPDGDSVLQAKSARGWGGEPGDPPLGCRRRRMGGRQAGRGPRAGEAGGGGKGLCSAGSHPLLGLLSMAREATRLSPTPGSVPPCHPQLRGEAQLLKEAFFCAFLKALDLHLKQREGRECLSPSPQGFDPNSCPKRPRSPFFRPATFL